MLYLLYIKQRLWQWTFAALVSWKYWSLCSLTFSARDADEREQWIAALENTVYRHSHAGKVGDFILYFLWPLIYLYFHPLLTFWSKYPNSRFGKQSSRQSLLHVPVTWSQLISFSFALMVPMSFLLLQGYYPKCQCFGQHLKKIFCYF